MDWINLHTSTLDSSEFIGAEPVDRGTWLCLLRYCAGQENGGRIEGARAWSDRRWQQTARVTLREINRTSDLWTWDGDAVCVAFYNVQNESTVKRLRSQAAAAGRARWHSKDMPQGMPDGTSTGSGLGADDGNGVGDAKRKERERKEKEGKEIPQSPADAGATGGGSRRKKSASTHPSEQPALVGERMLAINALLRRQDSTRWAADELAALMDAGLGEALTADDFASQLEPMVAFYAAKIPREIDFRRKSMLTLLRHWSGELDKARAWSRENVETGLKRL